MENNNENFGATNWNQPMNNGQTDLPNALGVMILGIVSLVCSTLLICCYGWIPGIITGIIGLVLGIMATRDYKKNPNLYTEKSYKNARAGKIMSIISLSLSLLLIIVAIIVIILGIALNPNAFIDEIK